MRLPLRVPMEELGVCGAAKGICVRKRVVRGAGSSTNTTTGSHRRPYGLAGRCRRHRCTARCGLSPRPLSPDGQAPPHCSTRCSSARRARTLGRPSPTGAAALPPFHRRPARCGIRVAPRVDLVPVKRQRAAVSQRRPESQARAAQEGDWLDAMDRRRHASARPG